MTINVKKSAQQVQPDLMKRERESNMILNDKCWHFKFTFNHFQLPYNSHNNFMVLLKLYSLSAPFKFKIEIVFAIFGFNMNMACKWVQRSIVLIKSSWEILNSQCFGFLTPSIYITLLFIYFYPFATFLSYIHSMSLSRSYYSLWQN